jgi:hypothetical protein
MRIGCARVSTLDENPDLQHSRGEGCRGKDSAFQTRIIPTRRDWTMRARSGTNSAAGQLRTTSMTPIEAYKAGMAVIRDRFLLIGFLAGQSSLVRAEQIAFQVRKIVEMIAFSALSAVEHRNGQILDAQRTKNAADVLSWLDKKALLKLPHAQRVTASSDPAYKAVFNGHPRADLGKNELTAMFSRASALVREWLWLHIVFHQGEGFLVQMGLFGTASFFVPIGKIADLPPGV